MWSIGDFRTCYPFPGFVVVVVVRGEETLSPRPQSWSCDALARPSSSSPSSKGRTKVVYGKTTTSFSVPLVVVTTTKAVAPFTRFAPSSSLFRLADLEEYGIRQRCYSSFHFSIRFYVLLNKFSTSLVGTMCFGKDGSEERAHSVLQEKGFCKDGTSSNVGLPKRGKVGSRDGEIMNGSRAAAHISSSSSSTTGAQNPIFSGNWEREKPY